MGAFLQTMDKHRCRVDQILSQGARQTVERNRRTIKQFDVLNFVVGIEMTVPPRSYRRVYQNGKF